MRKSFILGLALLSSMWVSCANSGPEAENAAVEEVVTSEDAASFVISTNTPIKWLGKKLTGEHYGTIATSAGELYVTDNALSGGKFKLDMNSITVLDITDPDKNADLTDHLKSDDFFAAANHPEGMFEITGVEALTAQDDMGNTHLISGNLTLKGIVQGIRFPAYIQLNEENIQAKAEFNIDRTLWDIRYRSGKFFPELGDKVINDQIGISFDIKATKG